MKFSKLQKQLKEKYDIDHLADIARELGVSPQAVSNWKARDRVPYKYVIKVREQLKIDDDSNKVIPDPIYSQHFEKDPINITETILFIFKNSAISDRYFLCLAGRFLITYLPPKDKLALKSFFGGNLTRTFPCTIPL